MTGAAKKKIDHSFEIRNRYIRGNIQRDKLMAEPGTRDHMSASPLKSDDIFLIRIEYDYVR